MTSIKNKEIVRIRTAFALNEMLKNNKSPKLLLSETYTPNTEDINILSEREIIERYDFNGEEWEISIKKNLALYLLDYLFYADKLDGIFQEFYFKKKASYKNRANVESIFPNYLRQKVFRDSNIKTIRYMNMYQEDHPFNKDFRFHHFQIDSQEFILISIQLGGDIRGNYSQPRIFGFLTDSDDFFSRINIFTYSCPCEYTYGYSEDGGNKWISEGSGDKWIYDRESGIPLCPKCHNRINFGQY